MCGGTGARARDTTDVGPMFSKVRNARDKQAFYMESGKDSIRKAGSHARKQNVWAFSLGVDRAYMRGVPRLHNKGKMIRSSL